MGFLLRFVDRLIAAGLSVAAALSASQFQAFVQHYLQRLGGHLDEARLAAQRLSSSAAYMAADPSTREGLSVLVRSRVEDLEAAMAALREASPLARPFAFLRHVDPGIASAAFREFEPSVPLDVVSLAYVAAAALAAPALYQLLKLPLAVAWSRRRGRAAS